MRATVDSVWLLALRLFAMRLTLSAFVYYYHYRELLSMDVVLITYGSG